MKNIDTLIIEDNPGDVFILKEQLKNTGWEHTENDHTSNLHESIELLDKIKPAVIFLDLNLPDSNGLDTFITLNKHIPDIPIIILSGITDTKLSLEAVKAGAQDFLVKGEYDEKLLLKTITYCIERKRNQLKLEEANVRYKLASKATNDPLWDWDMRTNKMYWNDKVEIFGYSDELGKNDSWRFATIHPDDKEFVRKQLEECLRNGEETWKCEYRFICADGSFKYILDRGYIVRDRDNKPYRMIGTMQDLTEKILLQQSMDEEKKLQQQLVLKANIDGQEKERDFIRKELHDNINQILTGTKLHLALIKKGDEENTMETVQRCLDYLGSAIEEIRRLGRAMSLSIMKEIRIIDSITALKNEINFLEICKIKFIHSGDFTEVPIDLSLNIFRITQEHLSNIIKHSKASNVVISLGNEERKLTLNIIDNGIGSDLSDIKELKGIGLLNMRNRVKAHNGHIDILTSPGNGFEINIEINY